MNHWNVRTWIYGIAGGRRPASLWAGDDQRLGLADEDAVSSKLTAGSPGAI